MRKPALTVLCLASSLVGCLAASNFVFNPSFEGGNIDFVSDYAFKDTFYPPDALDAGQYQIIQNLDEAHPAWAGAGSLSAQSGIYYFVANGSSSSAEAPWIQDVTISPGTITTSGSGSPVYYRFQAYIASVYPGGDQPSLSFEMSLNNSGTWQTLTTSVEPASAFNWYLTYADGYFGSEPTSIAWRLRNTVTGALGNDMALDSIYFGLTVDAPGYDSIETPINSIGEITGVPEPGTSALLLVAAAGGLLWRRKTSAQRVNAGR